MQTQRINNGSRGLTLVEACVALASIAVILAMTTTVLASRRGGIDAQAKLALLAQAHACYAADWNERQWSALPYDIGQFSNPCTSYPACVPQQLFGSDVTGGIWGYYLGAGSPCAVFNYPGNCSNWIMYVPLDFNSRIGSFRMPNMVGFREYVSQRFYSDEWYVQDDPAYAAVSTLFNYPAEFSSSSSPGYFDSSFCLSPAALFNPGVFRAREAGGYQSPTQFADSYRTPSVTQCTHPSLKSRMCEYGWYRGAPTEGLAFTAGLESAPYTMFFDGSVASVRMADAQEQDFTVYDASPTKDGLWTRETPFGKFGWDPWNQRFEGRASGFHMLTRDGILGRDLLTRDSNGGGK